MSFYEEKDPGTIGNDGEPKAPEHYKNALKKRYQGTLKTPIKPIKLLTLEDILEINEGLKADAQRDAKIEYSGSEDYPVKIHKLRALVEATFSKTTVSIPEIATFYLKNIIVLQAFPDGNHRTALYAAELFLVMNGHSFDYTPDEAYIFRKELYARRLREYKTYEERPTSVLKEKDNQVSELCLEFIRAHIR